MFGFWARTERAFPPPARQDPILLDPERKILSERTANRLPLRGERGTEEEYRFALACAAARERLAISYARRASGEKRPRLPSVFFREVASQLEGRRTSAEDAPLLRRADVQRIPGDAIGAPLPGGRNAKDRETVSASAFTAISAPERDRTYLQADVTRPAATATFAEAAPSFARAIEARRARRADRYSEWDGALEPAGADAADRLLGGRLLSPTAVQDYATCPQRFLMTHLLRIKTLEEPERTVRIDATRRGSLFHRIFERFQSEWTGKGHPSLASDANTRMRLIAEQECDSAAARGETGYAAMWAADREEIIEDCLQWLAVEREEEETSRFPLSACEARFGPPRAGEPTPSLFRDEPLHIEAGDTTLKLRRQDRPGQLGCEATEAFSCYRLQDREGPRRTHRPAAGRPHAPAADLRPRSRRATRRGAHRRRSRLCLSNTSRPVQDRQLVSRHDGRTRLRSPTSSRQHRRGDRPRRFHDRPPRPEQGLHVLPHERCLPIGSGRLHRAPRGRPAGGALPSEREGSRMSAKLKDAPARERIATNLDRNIGVEAAAGTGKTTVLVARIVNLLASGTATAEELVVITFTEKAAAELSTRVRDALERRAAESTGTERERVRAAARGLYSARIETIHGFATSLLRERPVEAGIDPLFEVLDDLTGHLQFERAYERFQDELLSEPREELETALRRGFTLTELKEACRIVSEHRYLLPLAERPFEGLTVSDAVAGFLEIADDLEEMLRTHQPGEDSAVPLVEGIVSWSRELEQLDEREQERRLVFGGKAETNLTRGRDASWGGEKARLKELQEAYRDLFAEGRAALRTQALLGLLPHVEAFVRSAEAERKREGVADYDDLLFWARDLIRDSAAARGYFRRRFRALLVDEFQDTDPVQAELALLLTSDEDPSDGWQTLTPATGRLAVVGDPKQSIYRFRRADIKLYEKVMSDALGDDHEQISTSFRGNPALLKALNTAFDQILLEREHVQPANVPLDAPPEAAEASGRP